MQCLGGDPESGLRWFLSQKPSPLVIEAGRKGSL